MIRARLKLAARRAVELCGGVDGAAATVGRGRSTTGRWHNINDDDLPGIDQALMMDMVAAAGGHMPPVTDALARELGFALLRLPDVAVGDGDWMAAAGALSAEAGEAVQQLCVALADGDGVNRREAVPLRRHVDDVIRAATGILALIDRVESAR